VAQETLNTPAPEESEDCLYLNVLTPNAPGNGRAVMIWIYGGALQFGYGGFRLYDGSALVAHEDVVYVSFNYRTNGKSNPHSKWLLAFIHYGIYMPVLCKWDSFLSQYSVSQARPNSLSKTAT